LSFISDTADDKPSTPPPEHGTSVEDSNAHVEDMEDKTEDKELIQHAEDTSSANDNVRLDSTCCC